MSGDCAGPSGGRSVWGRPHGGAGEDPPVSKEKPWMFEQRGTQTDLKTFLLRLHEELFELFLNSNNPK